MAHVLVVVAWVLGHQLQAIAAAGHQGGVVGVDRGHAVVPAQGAVPGAVVDHPAVFVRCVVQLRSLVHQGRRLKAFRGVVEPAPWVAEGELPALMTAGRWKSSRMPARYTERQAADRGAVARYYHETGGG